MQYFLYILCALIMFGFLIAIHEFGHFITAKLLGVKVNEFSIGMGPRLLHKTRGETEYSLRAFPIGGFCAMEGEDVSTEDPRSFECQAGWKKFLILVAGSFMNFLTGMVIFLVIFSQVDSFQVPVVNGFLEGAEYLEQAGLHVGDRIVRVDGHRINLYNEAMLFLDRAGDTVDLEVLRDGERVVLKNFSCARKIPVKINGQIVYKRGIIPYGTEVAATPPRVLEYTWYQSLYCVRAVWIGLGDLVTGAVGIREMSGVIGIVDLVGQAGVEGAAAAQQQQISPAIGAAFNIFQIMAFIAINLAVMNLLPIPALDGGRIFFLIVGALFKLVTRKKLNPKYEGWVNTAGFVLLMGFMAVVAASDILKLMGV